MKKKLILLLIVFVSSIQAYCPQKKCFSTNTNTSSCFIRVHEDKTKISPLTDPDFKKGDKYYWPPLMWAVALDDIQKLKILLEEIDQRFGRDPKALLYAMTQQDWAGRTPLYLAVEWINPASLIMIIEYAKKWFALYPDLFFKFITKPEGLLHWSPLNSAMNASFSDAVQLLVETAKKILGKKSKNFNDFINFEDTFGRTPLSLGIEPWDNIFISNNGGHKGIAEKLETKHHEKLKKELLKYSEFRGFRMQLGEVLRAGEEEEIDSSEFRENTQRLKGVLQRAGKMYFDKDRLFLDFVTVRDHAGWSPLMNAAADGNSEYVDLILSAANEFFKNEKVWVAFIMNNCDIHGRTVWHLAISRRHLNIIKTLIEVQKQIAGNRKKPFLRLMTHKTELNGFTPLITAAYESSDQDVTFAIIRLLVERAAEVLGKGTYEFNSFINRKDYDGFSALDYATTPRIRSFLKSYGAR